MVTLEKGCDLLEPDFVPVLKYLIDFFGLVVSIG